MKREKPDPYRLGVWLAIVARLGDRYQEPACALWRSWRSYAAKHGVKPGTPRSFSNALRKVGCPWRRIEGRRSRAHYGIGLPAAAPDQVPSLFRFYEHGHLRGDSVSTWGTLLNPDGTMRSEPVPLVYGARGLRRRWWPAAIEKRGSKWFLTPGRWVQRDGAWLVEPG